MPRKYERKLSSRNYRNYTQETLDTAIKKIQDHDMTIREAESSYGIHRNTLWRKLKEKNGKKPGGQTALTEEEEKAIAAHAIAMATFGFPITILDLRCIVKAFLDKKGKNVICFNNNFPGIEWARLFIKRHKNLTERCAKNISYSRAANDEIIINEFFNHFENELQGIPASNVWNYDETNLIDDPGDRKVITKRGTKYPEQIQNSSKACTSLMFCGNAEGTLAPIYVNYKAQRMHIEWTEGGPENTRYNRTPSGWFDSNVFEDWFMTLMLPILKKQVGTKILIGDNLSSHLNIDVLKMCEMHRPNIKFICLPPNATHLLQPLDVAYFRPLKNKWRQILGEWKTSAEGSKCVSIPKQEFPKLLKKLLDELVTGQQNLRAGFKKCGLFPLDRNEVIARLPAKIIERVEIDEAVAPAFIELLNEKRQEVTAKKIRRRTKVNIPPGKSISANDVAVEKDRPEVKKKKIMNKKARKQYDSDESDSVEEVNIPYAESDDSVGAFSDDSEKLNHVRNHSPHHCDSKQLHVDEYVVVNYNGRYFPGKISAINENGATVRTMEKCGFEIWRWPKEIDEIEYERKEIVRIINEIKMVGTSKRQTFQIPAMRDFVDFS